VRRIRGVLRTWWFGLLGKDPEAVVVTFLSGEPELARAMAGEVRRLIPDRRHYVVQPEPGSAWEIHRRQRRRFRGLRIGMSAVLFTPAAGYRPMRLAAFLLAPTKVLAFNGALERHHLRIRTAVASLLFWGGVPLDRIWLRPWWVWPWRKDRTVVPDTYEIVPGRAESPERRRVAVLSPYFPYPLSHGGAVRIFHLLREASARFDICLFAFIESEKPEDYEPVRAFCAELILVRKPRYREPRWSTIEPPEVREYRSPAMARALETARGRLQPGLLQVEYTHLAGYGGDVLVEHDVTMDLYRQVYERRLTVAAWWDWWRWQRFERRAVASFRRVVVMTEKDARLVATPRARVIANGVDLERFRPEPEAEGERVLFIGSFRHFPNVLACRFLIERVWPVLRKSNPGVTLTVVAGPDPMPHWRLHAGTAEPPCDDRIRLLEFVPDVRPLYVDANVVVVPTPVSAGTNVKVLEAMAMERAVVSTTPGCAGLGLEHGASVWIADEAAAFADGIERLLADPGLRARLAARARQTAVENFCWGRLGARQRTVWNELLNASLRIRTATAADLDSIARIQAAAPEASQWAPPSYLRHDVRVAERDGAVAGFIVSRGTAASEREILNLAVDPVFRRRGIATSLVRDELAHDPADLFLELRDSNEAARKLYESLGFQEVGRRRDYYETPSETAIVMRFKK